MNRLRVGWRLACLIPCLVLGAFGCPALADASPARPLPSAAAAKLGDSDASQYWDLTAEFETGHRIFARFQITNQGPGENNGTAIGHVVSPTGEIVQFRNGRLESGWTLSDDHLDLDIGKCHLDMHPPRYRLRINKKAVRVRLDFFPNAMQSIPRRVTGKRYRVDLLALGAPAKGSLRLNGGEEIALRGNASLTHTVATRAETEVALRRFELIAQRGPRPLYAVQFLDRNGGATTSWAAWLDARCDPAFEPTSFSSPQSPQGESVGAKPEASSLGNCIQVLGSSSEIEVAAQKRSQKDTYWVPQQYSMSTPADSPPGQALTASVRVAERLLKYEALDDLPGAIRWIARLSTRPRRVWSVARFDVTLPPSLDSEPTSIQSQGVAIVSYLNRVTNP